MIVTEKWFFLENEIRHYPWGSKNEIPSLLNFENTGQNPIAEFWMGAHASAPSRIITSTGTVTLDQAIHTNPDYLLGPVCRKKFGDTLPYLFKVLSAAHPLSIQAHPAKNQAQDGWNRENRLGIPLSSPKRNYHDQNHKPETILALSRFSALCGFRPVEETASLIRKTGIKELVTPIATLESNGDYRMFLQKLWSLPQESQASITAEVRQLLDTIPENTRSNAERHPLMAVRMLANEYPDDIGILSPLYLNTVLLEPGEALFLPAGVLHAYLSGTGLELMANSDNVLRGGLTKKHVDTPELLSVILPGAYIPQRIVPVCTDMVARYPSPAEEFEISIIQVDGNSLEMDFSAPSILLVTHGNLEIRDTPDSSDALPRGSSIFVPAGAGSLSLSGEGTAYLATVPHNGADRA